MWFRQARGLALLTPEVRHHPEKFARQVVAFADVDQPPVRIPFPSDTVAAIEAKHASDAAIINLWRNVSVSADF
ncbi:hypothetical protein [Rhizobium sp. Root708]|uniref:hypothetical protein n=1 Tax=Rhizobium sp. Root708 TaxID=1736592 RepID=UPI000B33BD97